MGGYAKPLTDTLASNPIPKKVSQKIEEPITKPEVLTALRTMAEGKSPGPDNLPAELLLNSTLNLKTS